MTLMKERFLLTGGSGLVGSYIMGSYSDDKEISSPPFEELDITVTQSVELFFNPSFNSTGKNGYSIIGRRTVNNNIVTFFVL